MVRMKRTDSHMMERRRRKKYETRKGKKFGPEKQSTDDCFSPLIDCPHFVVHLWSKPQQENYETYSIPQKYNCAYQPFHSIPFNFDPFPAAAKDFLVFNNLSYSF
jgi:hypothetical protein